MCKPGKFLKIMLPILITYAPAIISTIVGIFLFFYSWLKRPKNFPPGSDGWPIIGEAHKMFNRPEVQLMHMAEKYGPVMGVKMLHSHVVVLSDMEAIHQAFVKQGPIFAGRQKGGIFDVFSRGRGVAGIDGPKWKENRKFASLVLRQLGTGRKIMEDRIVEEMICMCEALQAIQGKIFDPSNIVTHSSANLICGIAFGERYDYSDLKFIKTARTLVDWFSEHADAFLVLTMIPSLAKIPPFKRIPKSLEDATDTLYKMLLPVIEDHKKKMDGYEFRDFVEAFLLEIEKNKQDPNTTYTEAEMKGVVRDFFVAGTDTTATTIRWTLIFLINRPNVQKKIQKEIDKVIGPDAWPKMAHLDEMHYTKAVMFEMLRHRTPGPLGLIHRTTEATKFMGYDIPKDTQVIANIWAVHRDPRYWNNPEEFRPERFLDSEGKFQKMPNYLPFSIGTRYCMGEALVKMEFFFFLVVILQRFHLEKEAPDAPQISEECVKSGQFLIAPRFKMKVKERFCRAKSILEYRNSMWE